jgi:hypothetical protein
MAQPAQSDPPARFGPYYRLESESQTKEVAAQQSTSGEVWGRTPRGSAWPQVQAYVGHLPADRNGIEFYTDIEPNPGGKPTEVRWSGGGPRAGVRTDGEFAKISCVITLVRYGS